MDSIQEIGLARQDLLRSLQVPWYCSRPFRNAIYDGESRWGLVEYHSRNVLCDCNGYLSHPGSTFKRKGRKNGQSSRHWPKYNGCISVPPFFHSRRLVSNWLCIRTTSRASTRWCRRNPIQHLTTPSRDTRIKKKRHFFHHLAFGEYGRGATVGNDFDCEGERGSFQNRIRHFHDNELGRLAGRIVGREKGCVGRIRFERVGAALIPVIDEGVDIFKKGLADGTVCHHHNVRLDFCQEKLHSRICFYELSPLRLYQE